MKKELNPHTIHLDMGGTGYQPILKGPPDSVTMRSGLVVLFPGDDVGEHSTENCEEIVIVLEGQGEVQITGQDPIAISKGVAVYCPPQTEHNVINTGTESLRYIYVVAKASR